MNYNNNVVHVISNAYQVLFSVDHSDSDSEDDNYLELQIEGLHREKQLPSRIQSFIPITITNSSDVEFQSHFRMSRVAFQWLLRHLSASLSSARACGRKTVDPEKQLLSVLWLLATPDSYRSVASRFDMGKSSLFSSFTRVIKALNGMSPTIIKWPQDRDHINAAFSRIAGIHGVIGAIDGSYVRIKAPAQNAEVYINRKCYHGVTLQAICDHTLRYTDCYIGYPSSVSDIRIFRNSDIYQNIIRNPGRYFNEDEFIIGDKAYPITRWCVPPYIDRGNLFAHQRHFNTYHAKTRQVIERSFALLFGRFRRLRDLDMSRTDLIPSTIIACCVLHNICLDHPDALAHVMENEGRQFINYDEEIAPELRRDNLGQQGIDFRDIIAANLQ